MNRVTPPRIRDSVEAALRAYGETVSGSVSAVYPALEQVNPALFGIAIADIEGVVAESGDADVPFALMSCAKPFVFAIACQDRGLADVRARVGVNATGLGFNSAAAVERDPTSRTNPMVNSGALATIGLVHGSTVEERWERVANTISSFAGREVDIDDQVYTSVAASNHGNRALADLLADRQALEGDPEQVTELYTRASCLAVTARDLAVMGATLANGGLNPVTGERVVQASTARAAVAVMAVAGLYEATGDWLVDVGLPAKSGIGGGIVSVAPGTLGLGTYSPPLDAAGNSVRGQLVAQQIAHDLELDIFAP